MAPIQHVSIVLLLSSTIINSVLFPTIKQSTKPNYWQMIPDASLESCLVSYTKAKLENPRGITFNLFECSFWKISGLGFGRSVQESGLMSFFSKPMGVVRWQWARKGSFTSYVYLNNKENLGFNLSFSEFSMGYSGFNCLYDKMLIENLDGLTVKGQKRYCGISPDWNHISLTSAIRITVETTGEYTTSILLVYGPVNNNDYERYDKIPERVNVPEQIKLKLGSGFTPSAQNIIKYGGFASARLIIAAHPERTLVFKLTGHLRMDSGLVISDGPCSQLCKTLFSSMKGTNSDSLPLLNATGQSNGPIISVFYYGPSKVKHTSIEINFQTTVHNNGHKEIFLGEDEEKQISSDDYCPSLDGIRQCSFSIVAKREDRPRFLFPQMTNAIFSYKGPDTDMCLYGAMIMYFDYDYPSLSMCREETDLSFWNIVSNTNMIIVAMYSYNNPISLTFTASLSRCRGHISSCNKGVEKPLFKLPRCSYVYRFPLTTIQLSNISCQINVDMEGAVGVVAKRGKWSGKCGDEVLFGAAGIAYLTDGYMGNTSVEEWPYLVPSAFRLGLRKVRVDIISHCRWSLTWLQIHATPYCGQIDVAHLRRSHQITFSDRCNSVRVPYISGTYRQYPLYSFPEFYKFKFENGLDWRPLDYLNVKCKGRKRKLCLSVHHVSRDSRCQRNCVKDTMRVRTYFTDSYVTDMEYASETLNNITLLLPQQRFRRAGRLPAHIVDPSGIGYENISDKGIMQWIYFLKRTRYLKVCEVCSIYHNMEVPIQSSSYLLDTTPIYLNNMEPVRPSIQLDKTKGISATIHYESNDQQYHIMSLVNASWLSAYRLCKRKYMSLLTIAHEDTRDILRDIYATVNVWAFRKALPVLAFLGIQPNQVR